MKKLFIILSLVAMVFATGCTKEPQQTPSNGTENGHEWVDLGLPSGTLWATCNIGAATPEDYGSYFAWGETTAKENYYLRTYKYYDGNNLTKYTGSDNLEVLETSDDAATANWGGAWRMPTYDEMCELRDKCSHKWITQNGVNGRLFTADNGNSIFLPAAGERHNDGHYVAGTRAYYWSSSLDTDGPNDAWNFNFRSGTYGLIIYDRYYGCPVRPVCSAQN